MVNKPPLGVSPHWFVYPKRIKDLHEAMGRFIAHIEQNHAIENHTEHFEVIAQWAQEIESLALLEAELEKRKENDIL